MKLKKLTATQKSIILAVLADAGVALTGYLSAKCALKAENKETKKEKAIAYIPAIAAGAATIGCISASTYISAEEITMATAACAAIGKRFADYKKIVNETATPEQLERIDTAFYEKEIERLEQELAERDHPRDDDDWCTFVDSYCGYTFRAPLEQVEDGLAKAMDLYDEQEFLAWSDIFMLANNGDDTPANSMVGQDYYYAGVGWSKAMFEEFYDGADFDFDICLSQVKNRPNAYTIHYAIAPEPCYLEY